MKTNWLLAASLAVAGLLDGCSTAPPPYKAPMPQPTAAFDVLIEASPPGARIEADGTDRGTTPVHLKIIGDTNRLFRDFGSANYVIRAYPVATNQYAQTRVYYTGKDIQIRDRIPEHIYLDMNVPPTIYSPTASSYQYPYYYPYVYPYPFAYYYPFRYYYYDCPPYYHYYYGPRYQYHYGPPVRYYGGPRYYQYRRY
jgi:hypothetical protein